MKTLKFHAVSLSLLFDVCLSRFSIIAVCRRHAAITAVKINLASAWLALRLHCPACPRRWHCRQKPWPRETVHICSARSRAGGKRAVCRSTDWKNL